MFVLCFLILYFNLCHRMYNTYCTLAKSILVKFNGIIKLQSMHICTTKYSNRSVCIVGSGPAGFGTAQYLLKNDETLTIDMIEKYPVPYGLIRYGVSPDHQDVKNCINSYEKLGINRRFSFYGNLEVGTKSLPLNKLLHLYDAVVLCTGAQEPRLLNLPGKNNYNIFTSKEFVGWYNGVPEFSTIHPDLSGKKAVILGVGNVALDCARMLLKSIEQLSDTDITNKALNLLQASEIKDVMIAGRRGLLQMSCTRKEMSEIVDIQDTIVTLNDCVNEEIKNALNIKDLKKRKQQRLVKYLLKVVEKHKKIKAFSYQFHVKLLRTPIEIIKGTNSRYKIVFQKNILKGDDPFDSKIEPLPDVEEVDCDLIIVSIGYDNKAISDELPFVNGKILESNGHVDKIPGLFVSGWCRMGAKGVLADTLNDSMVTGQSVIKYLEKSSRDEMAQPKLTELIVGADTVTTWDDWLRFDELEKSEGQKINKIREKITDFSSYLSK